MDEKIAWDSFRNITTSEELVQYFKGREYTHGEYCHYTSVPKIESILKNGFWLFPVSGFNDKKDSEHFGNEQNYTFSLCFSTGVNENLSLWYLYSGLDGKGARLSFTKSGIKHALESCSLELYQLRQGNEGVQLDEKIAEINESNSKVLFKDILYYGKDAQNGHRDLKYNTMTNHIFPDDQFKEYKANNLWFMKYLVWYHEKETRLIVHVESEELRHKIDSIIAKSGENKDIWYIIRMKIEDAVLNRFMKIRFAPEIDDSDMKNILSMNENISNFLMRTSKVSLSDYKGTIEMKLRSKCPTDCPNR